MRRRPLSRRPDGGDDAASAEEAAVRLLAGAAQTEVTLRRRLAARGFTAQAAAVAAVEMGRRGYLDDDAVAAAVASRRAGRGYGRAVIAADLRSRGVGVRPIDDALRGIDADEERAAAERMAIRLLARDRLRHGPDDPRTAMRVAGALARRGYGGDVVRAAVRAAYAGAAPAVVSELDDALLEGGETTVGRGPDGTAIGNGAAPA